MMTSLISILFISCRQGIKWILDNDINDNINLYSNLYTSYHMNFWICRYLIYKSNPIVDGKIRTLNKNDDYEILI